MAASSEEKGLLGSSFKSHRRYGSTSVNMKRPEHILRHRVSKLDTLQGIALKYGVTMECIKQHNKLWTTEAMFLRDYLEVPVSKDIYEHFEHTQQANGIHHSEKEEAATLQVSCESESSCSQENQKSQVKKSPSSPSAVFDCSEKNPLDFLSEIDNNIALMKTNIERMETHTYPMVDRMEFDDSGRRRSSTSSFHSKIRENYYQNGFHDPTAAPHPVVSQGRTITMSLKRLLREHDELYEL